jgi:hypothetical protein
MRRICRHDDSSVRTFFGTTQRFPIKEFPILDVFNRTVPQDSLEITGGTKIGIGTTILDLTIVIKRAGLLVDAHMQSPHIPANFPHQLGPSLLSAMTSRNDGFLVELLLGKNAGTITGAEFVRRSRREPQALGNDGNHNTTSLIHDIYSVQYRK